MVDHFLSIFLCTSSFMVDPFIQSNPNFITPLDGNGDLLSNFITDAQQWDEEKLYGVLRPVDAHAVVAIPLPQVPRCDIFIRHYEPKGVYSVRSEYELARELKEAEVDRSDSGWDRIFWLALWRIKVPKKILHFLWRLFFNILPTADNLIRRSIQVNKVRSICYKEDESIPHLFTECKKTIRIWEFLGWDPGRLKIEGSFDRWMENLFLTENEEEKGMFSYFFWNIWLFRNSVVFEEMWKPERIVAEDIRREWNECREAINSGAPNGFQMGSQQVLQQIASDYAKLSFDGAVDIPLQRSGAGVILRDGAGCCMAVRYVAGPLGTDAQSVEAAALREGLRFAASGNDRRVVIKGDAKVLLEDFAALKMGTVPEDISESWDTLLECVGLVKNFDDAIIKWIGRDMNSTAHLLAQRARQNQFSEQWRHN